MSDNILELCTNCKHEVPVGNLQMHIIYCKRNIQLCPVCEERVLRSELEDHNKEFHSLMTCSECNIKFQSSEFESHKKNICKKRIVACQYCNLELKAEDIGEHEDYCGSRTECCNECGRHIMLKFQHLHLDSNHKFIKLNENSLSDSDDEDLVMKTGARYTVSPRKTTIQKHINFPNGNSSGNISPSPKQNGLKQRKSKSHREDFSELSEYFKNMDLENGPITNATTTEINEILGRDRSSYQETYHPWLEDGTLIPCEFCKAPIEANNLVLHQTGCRPDLSSMQSSNATGGNPYQSYVRNLRREGVREINSDSDEDVHDNMSQVVATDEAIIPCEFCLHHFSLDDISGHQYLCRRNTSAFQ